MRQTIWGNVPESLVAVVENKGWLENAFFEYSINSQSRKAALCRLRMALKEDLQARGDFYGGEKELLRGQLTGDWFADLKGAELSGLDWVRSQGLTLYLEGSFESRRNEDVETMSKTHYCYRDFFSFHEKSMLLVETKFTRLSGSPEIRENLRTDASASELGISVLTSGGRILQKGGRTQINGEEPYAILCGLGSFDRLENGKMKVVLSPQLDEPGRCLLKGKREHLEIEVSMEGGLRPREITIGGLAHKTQQVSGDRSRVSFDVTPQDDGIVPLVILLEGDDWIAWKSYMVLVTPCTIQTSDERFNGVVVESLRSILMRRIYNVIPEEEPRGEMRFPGIFCGRFLCSANLAMFGMQGMGEDVLGLYSSLLKRDGYLRQDYHVDGKALENNAHFTFGTEGNDGLGFYLIQMGKLILANPKRRVDVEAITRAIDHLQQNIHWNGLLDSQSEPEDFIISEHTSGNPYTQGICVAGLKIAARALKSVGIESLSIRCEKMADLLSGGLKNLYAKDGYFSNRAYSGFGSTGKWVEEPYLSSYTALGPGTFALDDDIQAYELAPLISETVNQVQRKCLVEGRKLVMGDPDAVCFAYSQFGLIANLIGLGRLKEAEEFLDAALEYSETTTMKYILPEMTYAFDRDWWGQIDPTEEPRKLRSRYPWLYTGKQPSGNVFGLIRDSGNLIHIGYLLYLTDQFVGLSHQKDGLWISPRMLPGWTNMAVANRPSRFGPVSYQIVKRDGIVGIEIEKPLAKTTLFLDQVETAFSRVLCEGKAVAPTQYVTTERRKFGVTLPTENSSVRIELHQ